MLISTTNQNMKRLVFKNNSSSSHSKHRKQVQVKLTERLPDIPVPATPNISNRFGEWWEVAELKQVKGNLFIESCGSNLMFAEPDATFVPGKQYTEEDHLNCVEYPRTAEIFTAVPAGDKQVFAFKSGYNRFMGANSTGRLTGYAEAIGPLEQWKLTRHDKLSGWTFTNKALNKSLNYDPATNAFDCCSTLSDTEESAILSSTNIFKIWTNQVNNHQESPLETKSLTEADLLSLEANLAKKFQTNGKFDRLNKSMPSLKRALATDSVYEEMLDRRVKTKSDKFCK